MTRIVDTAPIVSIADQNDPRGPAVRDLLRAERSRIVIPAPVTAEVDYFLSTRIGPAAAERFLQDILDGTFQVECLTREEYGQVLALERRYAALAPGLADLSVVVLATRFQTRRLLTFDARHFRVLAPLQGGSFELLPA